MTITTRTRRWIAGAACAALALGTLVPAAEAGQRRGNGHKVRAWEHGRYVERVVRPHRTVIVRQRSSDVGPAIAGLIGGFVLGATMANAANAVEVRHAYYDPYCRHEYASFGAYERHARHCDHPRVVRVIDTRSGDCVHTYAWRHGDWRCEDDWDHRGRDHRGCDVRHWDDD